MVDSSEQGAVRAPLQITFELGQADQEQREERLGVPLVVEQDVQVGFDGQEEVDGGRARLQAEGVTEQSVEVPAAQRSVAAVCQAVARLRQKREDAAAIVIQQNNRQIQVVL